MWPGTPVCKRTRSSAARAAIASCSKHSLQATINRRVGGGVFLRGAYTYSHAIDMANYGDFGLEE